jgi:hypothetical protein
MISYGAKSFDAQAGLLKSRKHKSNEKLRLNSVAVAIDAPVATTTVDPIAQIGSGHFNYSGASLQSPQQEKVNVRDPMNSPEDCREDGETQPASSGRSGRLIPKSPAGNYNDRAEQIALLFKSNELSPEQISYAKNMTQQPVYKFFRNCAKTVAEADAAVFEILGILNLENISLYEKHMSPDLPRAVVQESLIPPLQPSLRKWIMLVQQQNNNSLDKLFLCVQKSDPLSDPAFYAQYLRMDKSNLKDVRKHLDTRIGEWNQSQNLLAEVLFIALKKTKLLKNSNTNELVTAVEEMWSDCRSKFVYKGSNMFWALKEILHAEPDIAAKAIKKQIGECKMKLAGPNTPDYISWIQQVYNLTENLKEYDVDSYNEGELLELFLQQYKSLVPVQHHPYDNLLKTHQAGELTWNSLKAQKEQVAINAVHIKRLQECLVNTSVQELDHGVKKAVQAHHVPAVNTSNKRTNAELHAKFDSLIEWSADKKCALHCAGKTGRTHTNEDCKTQIPIRQKAQSINQLHKALNELKDNMEKRQRSPQRSRSPQRPQSSDSGQCRGHNGLCIGV